MRTMLTVLPMLAAGFQLRSSTGLGLRRPAATMMAAAKHDLVETLEMWGPGQAVDPALDLLQILDLWDEDEEGAAEECMLGEDECCMVGPEPLAELCDRLDVRLAEPAMTELFTQVLKESNSQCVTAEKMRAALRGKVEKRSPPQSVMGGPPEGKSGADLKE